MPRRAIIAALSLVALGVVLWIVVAGSDGQSAKPRVTSPYEKKAVRIEQKLAGDPQDEKLLVSAVGAWLEAGSRRLEAISPRSDPIPGSVRDDYETGLRYWTDYLEESGGEAGARLASIAGATYFQMVELGSTDPRQATAYADGAVRAEKIVIMHEPNLLTLSDLAVYHYFNDENAAGDKVAREASKEISGGGEFGPKDVIAQLDEYKERGEKFVARVKRGMRTLEETGEDELEAPIKGYGAPSGLNGYEPGTY
jgi:hypothetical protein